MRVTVLCPGGIRTPMTAPLTAGLPEKQARVRERMNMDPDAFARAGFIEPLKASSTREAVRSETLMARQTGELASINAEVYSYQAPVATRVAGIGR